MEIVHYLEQKGKKGYLYLIDSSPKIVKSIASSLFTNQGFYDSIIGFIRALKIDLDLSKVHLLVFLIVFFLIFSLTLFFSFRKV